MGSFLELGLVWGGKSAGALGDSSPSVESGNKFFHKLKHFRKRKHMSFCLPRKKNQQQNMAECILIINNTRVYQLARV